LVGWLPGWLLGLLHRTPQQIYDSTRILPTLHDSNVKTSDPLTQLLMAIGWMRVTLPKPTLSGLELLREAGGGRREEKMLLSPVLIVCRLKF
jgi:hypothetical protein